jgi:hypothetical protein
MNILILGRGKGSWEMRGQQLGAAMKARVTSSPSDADWHWAERVVFVKRADPVWMARAKALGLPVVWDALDFWAQPTENSLSEATARDRLRLNQDRIQPVLTIGATQAMAEAARGFYLPHHGRRGVQPTLTREHVKVVGYDGNGMYLERWGLALQQACRKRGWVFVINPIDLSQVDILVALRGGQWDGWICREWKSGVKLVNAILAGRPIITQATAAQRELRPAGSVVADLADLPDALDRWASLGAREAVIIESLHRTSELSLSSIADRYQRVLMQAEAVTC